MSRRRQASRRPATKDGKYQSVLVARLVNTVMISGKKSTAQRIVYGAFEQLSEKNPASNPVEILQRAVDNAKPRIETKPRRVGGATYQVPLEVPSDRQAALALRWIVNFADALLNNFYFFCRYSLHFLSDFYWRPLVLRFEVLL
jgi:small subunit ribosomal protein S7